MTKLTARCLCGDVTWQAEGPVTWACHCHCESCRRATAAPMTTFIGLRLSGFHWTGTPPATYASSPGVERSFCGTCGTPMAFQAAWYEGEIHTYAATLDDPGRFSPEFHVHYDEKLPWLHLSDGLPKYPANYTAADTTLASKTEDQ